MPLSETLKGAREDTLKEILREAESRLSAQLTTALASDQRAMYFFGYISGIAVVSFGAALAALNQDWKLSVIGLIVGCGFGVAAMLAFKAAEPIDFELVGNDPDKWVRDIEHEVPFEESLAEQIAHYDEMLKANRAAMEQNAAHLIRAARCARGSVVVAAILTLLYLVGPVFGYT